MKIENLTLTNFNDRQYKVHTYILEQNPELVEQKRPLAIVVPGGVLSIYLKEKANQLH